MNQFTVSIPSLSTQQVFTYKQFLIYKQTFGLSEVMREAMSPSSSNDKQITHETDLFQTTPARILTPVTPTVSTTHPFPQLQNVVSTVNLKCELKLKTIAEHARNAEYNPKAI